jgi:hypothetical protein
MDVKIKDLVEISCLYGVNKEYVIAGDFSRPACKYLPFI